MPLTPNDAWVKSCDRWIKAETRCELLLRPNNRVTVDLIIYAWKVDVRFWQAEAATDSHPVRPRTCFNQQTTRKESPSDASEMDVDAIFVS